MIILSNCYRGLIARCEQCGALLGYKANDIYNNCYIYCAQCKERIKVKMDLSYDGLVKEKEAK